MSSASSEVTRGTSSIVKRVVFRDKEAKKQQKDLPEVDLMNIDDEIKVKSLSELTVGDHVIIAHRDELCRFTHAILTQCQADFQLIEIIYYADGNEFIKRFVKERDCKEETEVLESLDQIRLDFVGIKRSLIMIDFKKVDVYRFNYEIKERTCLSVKETILKAERFIGKSKYNLFVNNDEHFCIYAKTGIAAKLFILSPELSKKKIVGSFAIDLASTGGQVMLVNTAKHVATRFPRTTVETVLPIAADAASGILGASIEGVSAGFDIYKQQQAYANGRINTLKFKKYVAKRVPRGVMSVAGSIVGGILGQSVIPVPVAGAIIGSFIGGLVGAGVGQVEGLLLGELVERVDVMQKARKVKAIEGPTKKEKPKSNYLPEHKYHVIHHLVFRFDPNILRAENFEHLMPPDIGKSMFYTNILESEKSATFNKLIEEDELKEQISEQDYEIYVVEGDGADDTHVELNEADVRATLGHNRRVANRMSVEEFSADQLPTDLNIYFQYTDDNFDLDELEELVVE